MLDQRYNLTKLCFVYDFANVLLWGIIIIYSGAVGTAAVQIARALGAIVVGTAGTKDGMDVVTRFLSNIYVRVSLYVQ